MLRKPRHSFCSGFSLLSLVNFLQCKCHIRLSEQFSESQAAFGTTFTVTSGYLRLEQASWRRLLERFSELVSDFKEASKPLQVKYTVFLLVEDSFILCDDKIRSCTFSHLFLGGVGWCPSAYDCFWHCKLCIFESL